MQAVQEAEAVTTVESTPESTSRSEATARSSPKTRKLSKKIIAWAVVLLVILLAALTLLVNGRLKSSSRAAEATLAASPEAETTDPSLVRIEDQQLQSIKLEPVGTRPFPE